MNEYTVLDILRAILPHKEIGWKDIGETFYRFTLAKTPWFNLYLHALNAPIAHGQCHDHPWSFWTFILKNGYAEYYNGVWHRVKPYSLLHRPAEWRHNVVTMGMAWSLVLTGPRKREWGLRDECHNEIPN